jgi:tight adherence protein B
MLILLTLLIFVGVLGLSATALYFLSARASSRKQMRARLGAMQEPSLHPAVEGKEELIRQEVLSDIPALHRIFSEIPVMSRLQLYLRQAGLKMRAATLLLVSLVLSLVGFLFGLMSNLSWLLIGLSALGAAMIPLLVVSVKRQRRFSRFEELFPDALDLLARSVLAGHAFTTGFELIADEMPEPVAEEFRTTYDQQNLGLPLSESLQNLIERVPGGDVRLFVTALQIQRESGGNLAEILDNLSKVIRERFKLYRHIKTSTAEGRLSLYFLMALPVVTGILMYLTNPDYMTPLFEEPLGHTFIEVAVGLQILGYFVIRKITSMKV